MLENLLGTYLGHNFVTIVVEVLALLDIRHCSKLQSCAISKNTNKPNLRKCPQKTNFGPWPKFGFPNFFREFHLHWMLDIVTGCHRMQFQGKPMI